MLNAQVREDSERLHLQLTIDNYQLKILNIQS